MTLSRILGILALIATALTTVASLLNAIAPKYAVYALATAAAISAFTEKVTKPASTDGR
jgi:hypothetical protein